MSFKSVSIVWAKHSRRAETLAAELHGHVSFQYEARLQGRWLLPLCYEALCIAQSWKPRCIYLADGIPSEQMTLISEIVAMRSELRTERQSKLEELAALLRRGGER